METCDWTTRLSAYHDGELSADDAAAVEQHIAQCPACQHELRQYRRLSLILGQTEMPNPSSAVVASIKRQLQWEGNPMLLRLARQLTGVAAAVLVGGALWLITANTSSSAAPIPVHDWEAAAVSPTADASQQNSGDVQLAEWIETDLSRK
ncbi:MAG TPA: zf-HC2 domain-containing protein [Tepidisphaeraceae bacterium]|nr:zf-HC2 domain-containing protein [Tepidisphaeraceae bacterium]